MRGGYRLGKGDVKTAAQLVAQDENVELSDYFLRRAAKTSGKRQVVPKSVTQKRYLDAIEQHDIVFGIGPAGTGKTYLAMAQAVVVPAGQARQPHHPGAAGGRSGGEARVPARRPAGEGQPVPASALRRALRHDRDGARRAPARARHIEVAPIAFMRGRTLNDAFVILDEAQNTTSEQMKMFLTRLGFGSKAVITGDVTQIDLPVGAHLRPDRSDEGRRQRRGHRVRALRRQGRGAAPLVQQIVKVYEAYSGPRQ